MTATDLAGRNPDQPRHPIAVVSQRTGLSQDLLRAWERRYGAVRPARDTAGQRVYSDADVERLRLLQLATSAGRPIATLTPLPNAELARLVDEDARARAPRVPAAAAADAGTVDRALESVRTLDTRALESLLRHALAVQGIHRFLEGVAAPLLVRVGEEWHAGRVSVAAEHAASAVVEGIVIDAMRSMAPAGPAHRVLVATLAGSRHSLGAALVGASAAADGWGVVYLGADVPVEEIADSAVRSGAIAVAVSAVFAEDQRRMVDTLRQLRALLPPSIALIVGGRATLPAQRDLARASIETGASLADLRAQLARVAPGHRSGEVDR